MALAGPSRMMGLRTGGVLFRSASLATRGGGGRALSGTRSAASQQAGQGEEDTPTPPTASTSTLPGAGMPRVAAAAAFLPAEMQKQSSSSSSALRAPTTSSRGLLDQGVDCVLQATSTRNNTFLVLSSSFVPDPSSGGYRDQGFLRPLHVETAGKAGFKGAQRGTFDAGVEVAIRMFNWIRAVNNQEGMGRRNKFPRVSQIKLVWSGFGQGRDAVFRTLTSGEGDKIRLLVDQMEDATPIAIGGTRARKRRVV